MRLFIAIEMPDSVKEHFGSVQNDIKGFKGKLVNKEQMHLTLKFLGDVPDDKVEVVKEELKKVKVEKINCYTTNIGFFPSEDYIRVIWVGLGPKEKLIELQKKVDDSLKELFSKDKRFHPHLTLARVKFIDDKEKFKEDVKKIKLEKKEFVVDSFKLVKSTLMSDGPVYEVVEEFG